MDQLLAKKVAIDGDGFITAPSPPSPDNDHHQIPVAPQLVLRRACFLKHQGKLDQAAVIANSLLANYPSCGDTDSDGDGVAMFMMVIGDGHSYVMVVLVK